MTRTSTVLGGDCSGALRASKLNVAAIKAAIRAFMTSIFNLKKKSQNCKFDKYNVNYKNIFYPFSTAIPVTIP